MVHELDIPPGQLRLKFGGGLGGQRIEGHHRPSLGTQDSGVCGSASAIPATATRWSNFVSSRPGACESLSHRRNPSSRPRRGDPRQGRLERRDSTSSTPVPPPQAGLTRRLPLLPLKGRSPRIVDNGTIGLPLRRAEDPRCEKLADTPLLRLTGAIWTLMLVIAWGGMIA